MIRKTVPASLVLMLFLAAPAQAITILNLEGTGSICFFAANGSCGSTYTGSFSGVVTREVIGEPEGPDAFFSGTGVMDYNGWVHSTYHFSWGDGSYTYEDVASPGYSYDYAQVHNSFTNDILETYRESDSIEFTVDGIVRHHAFARMFSNGPSTWFSGIDFPEGAGLGGIADISSFLVYSVNLSTSNYYDGGMQGSIFWTQGIVVTTVPEPATLALLGLGLAGLCAVRRRRAH